MIKNHKQYIIQIDEKIKTGLYFRNPIQKIAINEKDYGEFNSLTYIYKVKHSFLFKLFQYCLGNYHNIQMVLNDELITRFKINRLCSPIYTRREYIKLKASSTRLDDKIQSIYSIAYNPICLGCPKKCIVEKTKIVEQNKVRTYLNNKHTCTDVEYIKEILK